MLSVVYKFEANCVLRKARVSTPATAPPLFEQAIALYRYALTLSHTHAHSYTHSYITVARS